MIRLADVFEALTGARPATASQVISEAAVDSRQVIPAGLFVALKGERTDGHDHLDEAFAAGAIAALVQEEVSSRFPTVDLRSPQPAFSLVIPPTPFCIRVTDTLTALQTIARFWRDQLDVRIIGITGTIGKSTTKELTAEVLARRFRTLKSRGNLNNEIGLPLTLLRLGHGHDHAVLEMGFYYPGEIRFLCQLARPVIGVVSNVGPTHASRAGSLEEIGRGKAELVESLPSDGYAVLNLDDPIVREMANRTPARVFYYGLNPQADLWADQVEGLGLEGIRFRFHYQGQQIPARLPLPGRHSVHTALRAAAVGLLEGMSWDEITAGLLHGQNQMRLVAVKTQSGALLLDDSYNSNPDSAVAALDLLAEVPGNRIAVLGDMLELGPYEQQAHVRVGQRAAEVCDELVTVGSRGRLISDAAAAHGLSAEKISWFPEVPEVIEFLAGRLQRGDVALVKGSLGMAMSRIITALEDRHV